MERKEKTNEEIAELNKNLLSAYEEGNLAEAEKLIEGGADKNPIDWEGDYEATALHLACSRDDIPTIEFILGKDNLCIEEGDIDAYTPLYYACENSSTRATELLLHRGADLEGIDRDAYVGEDDMILFHRVVKYNSIRIMELFINAGVDVNIRDQQGNTALHYAYSRGNTEVVKLLIEAGAK